MESCAGGLCGVKSTGLDKDAKSARETADFPCLKRSSSQPDHVTYSNIHPQRKRWNTPLFSVFGVISIKLIGIRGRLKHRTPNHWILISNTKLQTISKSYLLRRQCIPDQISLVYNILLHSCFLDKLQEKRTSTCIVFHNSLHSFVAMSAEPKKGKETKDDLFWMNWIELKWGHSE